MEGVYFSQVKIDKETLETYDCSKFLGVPAFPVDFLRNDKGESLISAADYFIMQLNLRDVADRETPLPKEGMLYFFIDVDTFKPKVFFTEDVECDYEVYDDINDGFDKRDFGQTDGYRLVFDKTLSTGHYFLGDINPDIDLGMDVDTDGYITLLEIDYLSLPSNDLLKFGALAPFDGRYIFLIKEADLKRLDFSKVKFVDKES